MTHVCIYIRGCFGHLQSWKIEDEKTETKADVYSAPSKSNTLSLSPSLCANA